MEKEKFDYEKYLDFEKTPFEVEPNEEGKGYYIVVGSLTSNFSNPFDKAGAQVLRDVKFYINPRATKNKFEVVDCGKGKDLNTLDDYQRSKLVILKRQIPTFFQKYKEATPEQFALFARKLLRPMRDTHCKNRFKDMESLLFQHI